MSKNLNILFSIPAIFLSILTWCPEFGSGQGETMMIRIPDERSRSLKLMSIGSVDQKSFYINPMNNCATWTQALDYCHQFGLRLATVDSAEESHVVKTYLKTISTFKYFWLYGTDFGNETQFHWLDTMRLVNYTDWMEGQPEMDTMSNCLYTGVMGWASDSCSNENPRPLCQKVKMMT